MLVVHLWLCVCVLAAWWWAAVTGSSGHCQSDWWTRPVQTAARQSTRVSLYVTDVRWRDVTSGVCATVPCTKQRSLHSHCGQLCPSNAIYYFEFVVMLHCLCSMLAQESLVKGVTSLFLRSPFDMRMSYIDWFRWLSSGLHWPCKRFVPITAPDRWSSQPIQLYKESGH